MSAKYDLLAHSKISDFDAAVDVSAVHRGSFGEKFRGASSCSRQKCVFVSIVAGLLLVACVTLITVIIVELAKHKAKQTDPDCPMDPPEVLVPCSNSQYGDEAGCFAAGCCWYGGVCVVNDYRPSCSAERDELFNCLPENDNWNETFAQGECSRRGCCWSNKLNPFVKCYFPVEYGYQADSDGVKETPNGQTVLIKRKSSQPSIYSNDIEQLKVSVTYQTSTMLRVQITNSKTDRYEVPLTLTSPFKQSTQTPPPLSYKIDIAEDVFGFEIKRTDPTARTIFKTAPGFVYDDQFLQLSAYVPSEYIYGLGEHATPWKLDTNYSRLTMFSRDIPPDPVYDTTRNLYGVHPFYLCMEEDGSAHGVFFVNSNAMEAELLPYPAITYRTIGGVMDFYYFMGPTPEDVINQYTSLIGRPYMPPYWALGFHLCRWGYLTANRTMEVVERMRSYGIPQDTQWNDIDYMHSYLDFTYNHSTFKELPQLVDNLHSHGQHYVVITDPGISATQPKGTYPPFDDGLSNGIFILNSTNQPILGKVWPGITAYPDFTNPKTLSYWSSEIDKFHQTVGFDGLWIDMNEPSNFVPGSISDPPCPSSWLNTPPYLPVSIRQSWDPSKLIEKTLCMTAKQSYSQHYNVHSLYGHTEAITTMNALEGLYKKRSLVISRSTYPGSGTHCGHWLGDNASQWPHIRQSIPGILNFALFGIPLVGADICGFFDNTTEELCTRWQQLGAFYPFSRNHNTYNANPQDPTEFSMYSIDSTRDVLLIRYKLLPFLYTLFYHAHVNGSTVGRPLLSVFPKDKQTWSNGKQFMWGDALLISPVLEKGARSVEAYFPESKWFDYRTGKELTGPGNVSLDAPLNYIPLHVRGGSIIPQQLPNTTTTHSRRNPFSILVAVDDDEKATGDLFIDDGEQLDSVENGNYTLLQFNALPGQLKVDLIHAEYTPPYFMIDDITVYGLEYTPFNITFNNQLLPSEEWAWSDINNVLSVSVSISFNDVEFALEWD